MLDAHSPSWTEELAISTPLIYQPPPPPTVSWNWNTPNILRAMLGTLCLLALLFAGTVALSVSQRRETIKSIKDDSAPSIIAAQVLYYNMADLDANVTNELIALPGQNTDAVRDSAKDRGAISENLLVAAKNITYPEETKQILILQNGMSAYDQAIQQARDFHERGDPAMLAAYRHAYDLVENTLFPAVEKLDKVNNDHLEAAYGSAKLWSTLTFLLTFLLGAGTLAALIGTQWFLSNRMKRTINPPLLAATLLLGVYLLWTIINFFSFSSHLKTAKEDAFISVRALWQTRAISSDANAHESRWLLDHARKQEYEKGFKTRTESILTPAPARGIRPEMIDNAYRQAGSHGGSLASELNNITFEGERDAAIDTIQTWAIYLDIDKRIRALENRGDHLHAVALCIGNDENESNWAFSNFDTALKKTLDINDKEYHTNLERCHSILQPYDVLNTLLPIALIVLSFLGLNPRLREYAV